MKSTHSANQRHTWIVYLAALFGTAIYAAENRSWTNKDGKTIQAQLLSVDNDKGIITLRIPGGKQYQIPIASLSEADVEFIHDQTLPNPPVQPVGLTVGSAVASPLGRGNPKDSDFKTLFAGKVAPAWDLTPSPEIEIFGGVHYLDPLEKAKQILFKGASPEGTRTLVSTFGFPYASTYYFSFNYECVPGFRHTAIITDAANQVVGLQFLNNTPKEVRLWGRHRPEWHCFNFLQNRGKGTSSYLIAHVLQMGDELIPDQGGQAAQQGPIGGFTGIPNPGMPNPGMPGKDLIPLKIGRDVIAIHSELIDTRRTSREWVILCLPRKYVGVMMSVLE